MMINHKIFWVAYVQWIGQIIYPLAMFLVHLYLVGKYTIPYGSIFSIEGASPMYPTF